MNTRNLLKNIFGKERGITKEDIDEKIIKIQYKESAILEFKTLQKISKIDDENKEKQIIAPLIGFLNKFISEGGVLILGVDCKNKTPTRTLPIEERVIRNDSQLRSWITSNIVSVPMYYTFPIVEIEEISIAKNQKIYAIEIKPIDSNVVYFSRISDYSYRRVADETTKIPLLETLRLIEEKRISRLIVDIQSETWKEQDNKVEGKLKITYNNMGSTPGYKILSIFIFTFQEGKDKDIIIKGGRRLGDVTNLNVGCVKVLQHEILNRPLYPKCPTVIGNVEMKFDKSVKIKLMIKISEEKCQTVQIFTISKDGIKKEKEPQFNTYI